MTEVALGLAWVPFKHPIGLFHEFWYLLLVPLSLGLSVTWKALRLEDMRRLPRQTLLMTSQIVLGMIGLAVLLGLFVYLVIERIPVP